MNAFALVYNGHKIGARNEKLCLTDMWIAAGSNSSKTPAEWLRSQQANDFIEFLVMGNSHDLVNVDRGRNARTWAHWQLGMAFAKYQDPAFHAWCNEVVRRHMEERGLPVHAVQGAITVDKEQFQQFAVTLGESAGRSAIIAAKEIFRGEARQFFCEEIDPRLEAIENRFDRLEDEVSGRSPASKDTISKHIRANWRLGGRCPCCCVNYVSNSDGSRAPRTHLDHFLQVGKKNLQSTWIVCRDCNLKKLPKDRSGCRPAFDAYQKRLIEIFGREEYFGAQHFQSNFFT